PPMPTSSFRDLNPDMVTLPQYFSENGYDTVSYGKIFHGRNDEPHAWNQKQLYQKLEFPRPGPFALEENRKQKQEQYERMVAKYGESGKRGLSSGPAYESADVPDHAYKDGYNTEAALLHLEAFAAEDQEKPFFLALGFSLPHLNWTAPQTYWDLYDREALPLATQVDPPREGAATGLHASFELRVRALIPKKGPMGDDLSRTLLHAYLACTSYVDTLVGKALTALDDLGLQEDTIIVLWGDHGWHLGEMGVWGKATNYEIGTRVPFIISTPGMEKPGHSTDRIVELLDIFPTLCQLSGLPMPNHLEGESLLPLLQDPSASWDKAALSQFPNPALREWAANPLSPAMRETFFGPLISEVEERIITQQGDTWDRDLFENHLMGYALRTDTHRAIFWLDDRDHAATPLNIELFDHRSDPEETVNIARQHPELVETLRTRLLTNYL
ncbi:MAG: sulfatase, partial [Verrucomicrobiota bacterium]